MVFRRLIKHQILFLRILKGELLLHRPIGILLHRLLNIWLYWHLIQAYLIQPWHRLRIQRCWHLRPPLAPILFRYLSANLVHPDILSKELVLTRDIILVQFIVLVGGIIVQMRFELWATLVNWLLLINAWNLYAIHHKGILLEKTSGCVQVFWSELAVGVQVLVEHSPGNEFFIFWNLHSFMRFCMLLDSFRNFVLKWL